MSFGAPTPPAGGSGSGVDATARAAAAAAQAAADEAAGIGEAAQATADSAHSGSANDSTARAAASAAQATATSATTGSAHDSTARAAAAAAQAGSGNDSTARAAAVAAQADADALETLTAHRASRIRLHATASQSTVANTATQIAFDAVAYATGAFAGHAAGSSVTIPAGVSKIRIMAGSVIGVGTSGGRVIQIRRRRPGVAQNVFPCDWRATAPSTGTYVTLTGRSQVIEVMAGDIFEAFATTSVASTLGVTSIDDLSNSTYLEIEVVE